ncbi:MAG TPA: sirohydrochlorin cobaltochelatase [Methanotrichaceae archaeon]|nr:sirohydrochlorin cobaltochelatase [Methanotrichaceae archaeon]
MIDQDKTAVLLVAYGTRDPAAYQTYLNIKAAYENEFQSCEVSLAFTAGALRKKMAQVAGIAIYNPFTALAELQDRGYRNIAIQSLQIVPGSEFHHVSILVQSLRTISGRFGFGRLAMGMPLLSGIGDCRNVSRALSSNFDRTTSIGKDVYSQRASDEAVVLMGHGTGHPADSAYCQMAQVLGQDHSLTFLGTLDGYPGRGEVLEQLRDLKVRKIRLMPFLLVAGAHALSDLAGDGPGSWKSAFEKEGFDVEVSLQGLGENEEIVKIFLEHTRASIGQL